MLGSGRYQGLDEATVQIPDGAGGEREVRYLRRRTPPDPATLQTLAVHRVAPDDRLDLITARFLGDPTAFWRVCDANAALDPDHLVGPDAAGSVIVIPVPGM